jgi:protein ImuB
LTILPASDTEESCAKTALLEAVAVYTPRIETQAMTDTALSVLLDISGTTWMWGDPASLARRVSQTVRELCFTARFIVSSNAHASLCLASVPRREPLIVRNGDEANALASLPIACLPLSSEQAEALSLWGLSTFGDLAALSIHDVTSRMGMAGKRLHAIASGSEPHLFVPQETEFLLQESMEFDEPVVILDSLLFVLGSMLHQIVRRAASRSYALASITTEMKLEGGGEHTRVLQPALPSSDRSALLKLLHLDLQAHPPSAGVVGLSLTAQPGDRSQVQAGLFAPQLPEALPLDVTLARIAAMVGDEYVGRAKLLDTHADAGFVMEKFTAPKSSDTYNARSNVTISAALRRCRPPQELRVSTNPRENPQQPMSFYFGGRLYVVVRSYGPWRRSGDWWSSEVWSFEEWDIRARSHGADDLLCVLKHNRLSRTWTMDALYD